MAARRSCAAVHLCLGPGLHFCLLLLLLLLLQHRQYQQTRRRPQPPDPKNKILKNQRPSRFTISRHYIKYFCEFYPHLLHCLHHPPAALNRNSNKSKGLVHLPYQEVIEYF